MRPYSLQDYIGQTPVREQMALFIEAALTQLGEALDHTLVFGPPGLGNTRLCPHYCARA